MTNLIRLSYTFFLIIYVVTVTASAVCAASPPRMRPYTGIGVLVFSQSGTIPDQNLQSLLYEEPGLLRVGILNNSRVSGNEWIFGGLAAASPLVVSARKGEWLRIFYDDAGREAWVEPRYIGHFHTWEQFLKLQTGRMLPGLQPQYYQLQQQPGGTPRGTLTPKLVFKVLKLEENWAMVLTEQSQLGWLRWRDYDGRLTVGTGKN